MMLITVYRHLLAWLSWFEALAIKTTSIKTNATNNLI